MIYLKLFLEFLVVGFFSLGGGYATIPLIEERIIGVHHWITQNDFINMITISQMTPGPLTVNISTFVGLRIGGILGSVVATLGAAMIGVMLTLCMSYFYKTSNAKSFWNTIMKGLRISSTALILLATIHIFALLFDPSGMAQFGFSFMVLLFIALYFKLDTTKILLLSGIFGFFFF